MPIKPTVRFFALAALFLVPIFPLIVANDMFFPFITGKAFYFRILVEIAFAAWAILAFIDAKYRPKLNALTVGVTVFALVALVADLVGVNPIRSLWSNFERMEGWITIAHLWMFFIVTTSIFGSGEEGKQMWHRWLNTSLAVSFIVACYGFAQIFGWAAIHQSSSRVDASLGNAAYMAVYMLISAGFAAYLFLVARKNASVVSSSGSANGSVALQWIYGILTVAFSFLLYETATRGTILGLVGGIMLGLLVYSIFAKDGSKISRGISGGIVAAIIIVIISFIALRHQPFIENSPVLGRMASISFSSSETTARLYIWNMALTGFEQRPVLGWGQENFNYIFNANYSPAMYGQEQWFDRAHSVYLDWLVNSGIIGLFAYLALYVLAFFAVWKSTLTIAEKSVLTGLFAGYAVHNLFVFDNLASYVLFFAMLGFVSSLSRKESPTKDAAIKSVPITIGGIKEASSEIVEYAVTPIMIVILVAGVYMFSFRPIQQNTRLIAALQDCSSSTTLPDPASFQSVFAIGSYVGKQEAREQLLSCAAQVIASQQIPNATKEAFYVLANQEIANQIAATPKDARIYTLAGSFMSQIGSWSQARSFMEQAHLLSPAKQSIDFQLANDYVNLGQNDQAVALLKTAYESAPEDADAKDSYATVLVIAGKDAEAKSIFGNDPALFQTESMAEAYAAGKDYSQAISIYKALIGTSTDSTDSIDIRVKLAQTEYTAGLIKDAVATLQSIAKDHPEYQSQIDSAVKQVQAPKQ
jgi:O-antigen ligase/Flp pilus assembly protein TadD